MEQLQHLTIVIFNKQSRVTQYGKDDGGLGDCGLNILDFLKTCDLEKFKSQINKCRFLTPEEFQDSCYNMFDSKYSLLDINLSSSVLTLILNCADKEEFLLEDFSSFQHSSKCKYCYIIDLDYNRFTVQRNHKNIGVFDILNLPSEDKFMEYDF